MRSVSRVVCISSRPSFIPAPSNRKAGFIIITRPSSFSHKWFFLIIPAHFQKFKLSDVYRISICLRINIYENNNWAHSMHNSMHNSAAWRTDRIPPPGSLFPNKRSPLLAEEKIHLGVLHTNRTTDWCRNGSNGSNTGKSSNERRAIRCTPYWMGKWYRNNVHVSANSG